MSYIGRKPTVGNFQICDAISVVNNQAAYTMQVGSVNVIPQSANHMIVSLNGVIQKPNSSFTVSGSTITFSSNLATGDVIDFIQILGDVLDLGVPSDATVTDAKTNFVSTSSAAGLQIKGDGTTDGTLQLNCSQNSHGIKLKSPPHSASASYTLTFPNNDGDANQVLTTNGSGVLTWASGGITIADQWRLTSSTSGGTNAVLSANWERNDGAGFGGLGSALTQSSGVFTFPATGFYLLTMAFGIKAASDTSANVNLEVTVNNSSYTEAAIMLAGNQNSSSTNSTAANSYILDVTNTTNVKIRFKSSSMASGSYVFGDTGSQYSGFSAVKLADT